MLYLRSEMKPGHPHNDIIEEHIEKGIGINLTIEAELEEILRLLRDIDTSQRITPSDLISPKRRKPLLRYTLAALTLGGAFLVFKLSSNTSLHSFPRPIWNF
jgi:hypothetical protein